MKIDNDRHITLTLGQLRRLVKESSDELLERALVDSIRTAIAAKVSEWEENAPELALPAGMEDTLAQEIAEALMCDYEIVPLSDAAAECTDKVLAESHKRPNNYFGKRSRRRFKDR